MGFYLNENGLNAILECLGKEYKIYGPIRITGGNTFSDVDCIRYGVIKKARDIVFDQKSNYSFKEVLFPVSQTLLSFTDERICEAEPEEKGSIVFLRSCDLHAVKRLDGIFLQNGHFDRGRRAWRRFLSGRAGHTIYSSVEAEKLSRCSRGGSRSAGDDEVCRAGSAKRRF